MIPKFRRFIYLLDRFEEIRISSFLALAAIISFTQVVLRYLFSASITWAAEASTFLLIWTALIGASYGVRKKIHIGVDTFINLLPDRWYRLSVIAAPVISLVYTVALAWLGIFFIRFMIMIGQVSPDLEWPMWVVFLVVPLSGAMMTIRFVQQLAQYMKCPPKRTERPIIGELPSMTNYSKKPEEN
ncbi:MAG: hypothetical protein IEMM0002_0453 [bacterium]|nr:MAG: hypothetical protein IEMM0002_0453 [bacterium]